MPLLHLGVGREGGFTAPDLADAHADHLVLDEAGEGDGAMPEEGEGIVDVGVGVEGEDVAVKIARLPGDGVGVQF